MIPSSGSRTPVFRPRSFASVFAVLSLASVSKKTVVASFFSATEWISSIRAGLGSDSGSMPAMPSWVRP